MLWIIGAVIVVAVVYVCLRIFLQMRTGTAALAQFELPEDSDKESFVDPKTGRRYDSAAYEAYLSRMVHNMTDQQMQNLLNQYGGRDNIWNQKMCDAIRVEQDKRADAAELAAEESEILEEEINEEIAPFFWVVQSTGASVGLSCGECLRDLFAEHGMTGSGSDWDSLAKTFISERADLRGKLQFDSQADLFCVYSRDTAAVKQFAYEFRGVCEDRAAAQQLFERMAR